MKLLKKSLIIPCLTPLILVLFVSSFNLNNQIKVRLLTWRSPQISLGLLMIIGGCTGALLSASSTIIYGNQTLSLRRDVVINPNTYTNFNEDKIGKSTPQSIPISIDEQTRYQPAPERELYDPNPTISVPFKIVSKIDNQNSRYSSEIESNIYEGELPLEDNYDSYLENSNEVVDTDEQWGEMLEEDW